MAGKATPLGQRAHLAKDSASAESPGESKGKAKRDVLLVHGTTPDGRGLEVIRQRDDQLETGAIRPLEQGKPIQGEVLSLEPHKDFPLLCDVKVELPAPAQSGDGRQARASRSGPAQVASDRYRKNWDSIWKRQDMRRLPN